MSAVEELDEELKRGGEQTLVSDIYIELMCGALMSEDISFWNFLT